jgi:hypothetical protein
VDEFGCAIEDPSLATEIPPVVNVGSDTTTNTNVKDTSTPKQ